jgi:hypothetical protein
VKSYVHVLGLCCTLSELILLCLLRCLANVSVTVHMQDLRRVPLTGPEKWAGLGESESKVAVLTFWYD